MRLTGNPRTLKLNVIVGRLEADFALVEFVGENNRCVLTGACALEHALVRATEAFFRELGSYSLADLVSGRLGVDTLDRWRPLTRRPKP